MKKRVVILILTLVFLAGAMAAAGLPLESRAAAATSKPTETPAVTPGSLPEISPAPEETEPLAGIGGILTVRQCGKDTSAFFCGLIGGILLLLCQLLLSLCFSGSREWGLHSSVPVAILLRVGLILTEVLGALAGKPRKDSNRAHHRPPMAD